MAKRKYIPKPAMLDQITAIRKICGQLGLDTNAVVWNLTNHQKTSVEKLTFREAADIIKILNTKLDEKAY